MQLINIGFGNLVSADKIVAVVAPDSAPIKRIVQDAKEQGLLIDATYGRYAERAYSAFGNKSRKHRKQSVCGGEQQ